MTAQEIITGVEEAIYELVKETRYLPAIRVKRPQQGKIHIVITLTPKRNERI